MTNFYKDVKTYGVQTFGYAVGEVKAALTEEMQNRFDKAAANLADVNNRALVQACYNVYMQMKSVAGGEREMLLDDETVNTTKVLILQQRA